MARASTTRAELRQLWAEYEAALWAGLVAARRQSEITVAELDEMNAELRKGLKTLGRLRELIDCCAARVKR